MIGAKEVADSQALGAATVLWLAGSSKGIRLPW